MCMTYNLKQKKSTILDICNLKRIRSIIHHLKINEKLHSHTCLFGIRPVISHCMLNSMVSTTKKTKRKVY